MSKVFLTLCVGLCLVLTNCTKKIDVKSGDNTEIKLPKPDKGKPKDYGDSDDDDGGYGGKKDYGKDDDTDDDDSGGHHGHGSGSDDTDDD